MKRVLPAPLLSAILWLFWLVLNQTLDLGQVLFGLILAVLIPLLTAQLRPTPVRIRRPMAVLRLMLSVVVDTSVSNLAVIRLLLAPSRRQHAAGFVAVPLVLRDPNALAVLATIVCITPGTAWAELSADRTSLLIHVLELNDAAAIAAHIKHSYERPLMEIFE